MPLAVFPKCFLDALCVERTMTIEEWVDLSASIDVDGLEFYWGSVPADDPARIERLRRRVEEQGRSIPMMCYSPDFTHPDARDRAEEVDRQRAALRVCAALGVEYCRVLSGQRRPTVSREEGLQWVSECIRELLPDAEKLGVRLILENHYKDNYWQYPEFAQRQELFLELLDRIGESPWFGVNYDPSNTLIAGEDPVALLEAVKHRVITMHASDRYFEGGTIEDLQKVDAHPTAGYAPMLRHGVVGKGAIPYERIFPILQGIGFRGWISIEDGSDPVVGMDHLRESADYLRREMRRYELA